MCLRESYSHINLVLHWHLQLKVNVVSTRHPCDEILAPRGLTVGRVSETALLQPAVCSVYGRYLKQNSHTAFDVRPPIIMVFGKEVNMLH